MRSSRPLRSAVTGCLLALLLALATGVPTHHHLDAGAAGDETRVVSTDHHDHATQLVEQDDRVPSGGLQLAPPVAVGAGPMAHGRVLVEPVPSQLPRARERAPPPGAPRAPPHRI